MGSWQPADIRDACAQAGDNPNPDPEILSACPRAGLVATCYYERQEYYNYLYAPVGTSISARKSSCEQYGGVFTEL